jgi:hypothetical protein
MSAAGFEPAVPATSGRELAAADSAVTGTGVKGVGPVGLAYPRYNFLFYGMSPTSKPTVVATSQIYHER